MRARLAGLPPPVHRRQGCRSLESGCHRCCQDQDCVFDWPDQGGGADGLEVPGSPDDDQVVSVGVGVSVGEDDCVDPEPEVVVAGDDEVLGFGVVVDGVTGQVDGVGPAPVFVPVLVPAAVSADTGCVVAVAVVDGTAVAGAVPEAFAAALGWRVWAGVAPASAGDVLVLHPLSAVGCAVPGDFPATTVPIRPPDEPLGVGVTLFACAPLPSVPALPRGVPPPPLSEELASSIAWRNG